MNNLKQKIGFYILAGVCLLGSVFGIGSLTASKYLPTENTVEEKVEDNDRVSATAGDPSAGGNSFEGQRYYSGSNSVTLTSNDVTFTNCRFDAQLFTGTYNGYTFTFQNCVINNSNGVFGSSSTLTNSKVYFNDCLFTYAAAFKLSNGGTVSGTNVYFDRAWTNYTSQASLSGTASDDVTYNGELNKLSDAVAPVSGISVSNYERDVRFFVTQDYKDASGNSVWSGAWDFKSSWAYVAGKVTSNNGVISITGAGTDATIYPIKWLEGSSGLWNDSADRSGTYRVVLHQNIKGDVTPLDSTARIYVANSGTQTIDSTNIYFSRTGYTMQWSKSPEGPGTAEVTISENRDLYSIWTASTYTITLNQNGATTSGTTSVSATYEKTTNFTITKPKRIGYTFIGWKTTQGGATIVIDTAGALRASISGYTNASSQWVRAQDTTLYALWSAECYTITLDKNASDATAGTTSIIATYESTVYTHTPITNPTRTGYTFVGWYSDATAGDQVITTGGTYNASVAGYTNASKQWVKAGPATLYAHWTGNQYTITYNANTGYGYLSGSVSGVAPAAQTKTYGIGSLATNSGNLARFGYSLTGWNTKSDGTGTHYDLGQTVDVSTTAGANVTLYAEWTGNIIKLTMDPNGGTVGTQYVWFKYGTNIFYSDSACSTKLTSFTKPTRTGYVWDRYYGDGTCGGNSGETYISKDNDSSCYLSLFSTDLCQDIYKDATLKAEWSANTYTIAFDKNGGSGAKSNITATYDKFCNFTSEGFTKTGYLVGGWTITNCDGVTHYYGSSETSTSTSTATSISYPSSVSVNTAVGTTYVKNLRSTSGTVTVKAVWTPVQYTISYNANSSFGANNQTTGTVPANQTKTYGTALTLATNSGSLAKVGYTFGGWNTNEAGTGTTYAGGASLTTDLSSTSGATVILYAKWNPITYTIKYDGNGNTDGSVPGNQTKTYGQSLVLAKNTGSLVKTGYNFAGWNTNAAGTGTPYAAGATLSSDLSTSSGATVTLYAAWGNKPYTLTLDGNGGTGNTASVMVIYNASTSMTYTAPTRTGYTFQGWTVTKNGTDYLVKKGSNAFLSTSYTSLVSGSTYVWTSAGDQKVYAKWTANTYDVGLFTSSTATSASRTVTATYESTTSIANTFTNAGYTFAGWYDKTSNVQVADASGNFLVSVTGYTNARKQWVKTGAASLYAGWTPITYTGDNGIILDQNEATTNGTTKLSVTYATTTEFTITNPLRNGYTFGGWTSTKNGATVVIDTTGALQASVSGYTNASSQWIRSDMPVTLYAKWDPIPYTITYVRNGGTGTLTPTSYTIESTEKLPTPSRTGYAFGGWKATAVGNWEDKVYAAGTSLNGMFGNVTLTETWTTNTYKYGIYFGYALYDELHSHDATLTFYFGSKDWVESKGTKDTTVADTTLRQSKTYSVAGDLGYIFSFDYKFDGTKYYLGVVSTGKSETVYSNWMQFYMFDKGVQSKTPSNDAGYAANEVPISAPSTSLTEYGYNYTRIYYRETQSATVSGDIGVSSTAILHRNWPEQEFTTKTSATGSNVTTVGYNAIFNYGNTTYKATVKNGYKLARFELYDTATNTLRKTITIDSVVAENNKNETGLYVTNNADGSRTYRWYDVENNVLYDQTVKVITEGETYTQTFIRNYNDSDNTVVTTADVVFGSAYGTLTTPTRTGYDFKGWWTARSGGTQILDTTVLDYVGARTLYAHWQAQKSVVTLMKNYDATEPVAGTVTATFDANMPTVTIPTREGYEFIGYYDTSATTGGTQYYNKSGTSNHIWDKTGAQTLWARWSANAYTITLNTSYGTIDNSDATDWALDSTKTKATKQIKYDSAFGTLPTVVAAGRTFKGWYVSLAEDSQHITETTILKNSSTTQNYQAKFDQNTYTLTADPNGGTLSATTGWTIASGKATKTVTYDAVYGTMPSVSRTGYLFQYWRLQERDVDYSVMSLSTDGARFSNDPSGYTKYAFNAGDIINFQVLFTGSTAFVEVDVCDITLTSSQYTIETVTGGKLLTVKDFVIPDKSGYSGVYGFIDVTWGSNDVSLYKVQKYTVQQKVIAESTIVKIADNHTATAVWNPITYTISYNGNGNTSGEVPANQTKTYATALTLRSNTGSLAKTGYEFKGWNTATNGSGTHYDAGATLSTDLTTENGKTITLYAQ